MKNRKLKLGIMIIAAVTLFTATAFASASGNEGYDALKQIMMNQQDTREYYNATVNGTFQVTDNGSIVAEATGIVKGDHEASKASGNVAVKLMGSEQTLSFYKNLSVAYLVDETNGKYYQPVNMDKKIRSRNEISNRCDSTENRRIGKAGEALMDYFVGDLKSQFALAQNGDGTKSIILDLDQNEIPTSINLLVGAAVENKGNEYDKDYKTRVSPAKKEQLMEKLPFLRQFEGIENVMPRLETDVKLQDIYLKLNVDEKDQLKSFDVKISISGNDSNGATHDITFSGSAAVSDLNNTVVDTFNPEGKTIETIDMQEFEEYQ